MNVWTWANLTNANGTPTTTREDALTVLGAVFPGLELGVMVETDASTGINYLRVELPDSALEVENQQGWAEFGQAGIGLVLVGDPDANPDDED